MSREGEEAAFKEIIRKEQWCAVFSLLTNIGKGKYILDTSMISIQ